MIVLPAFSYLNLQEARADSESDEIVAVDLLTVREPRSQAESRLRVIRLTTRSGTQGYGDYLAFGLPAEDEEETLARLVNRYAEQNHKKNIFLTDPSMRAVGVGHTVMGQTADVRETRISFSKNRSKSTATTLSLPVSRDWVMNTMRNSS